MGRFLTSYLLVLTSILLLAAEPVSVTVTPRVGIAPLFVRVRVTVDPNAENRSVCLQVMNDGITERSSCWELYGLDSPRTFYKEYQDLDAGELDIIASVFRSSGTKRSVPVHVQVIPRF